MNLSWMLPAREGIPVLMYHKVWPGINDHLTITPEHLRAQWTALKDAGYQSLSITEYLDIASGKQEAPPKAVLITFDDGYRNNFTYAYPLLKEFGWKATFFIIANTLDILVKEKAEQEQKMSVAELLQMDPAIVQLGIHGYEHLNMGRATMKEMETELADSIKAFADSGLPFHKVFAYPYGARSQDKQVLKKLKERMEEVGYVAAFRIGNRPARVPAPDIFEIKRIDIRGTDTLNEFKTKLKKGKLKPF